MKYGEELFIAIMGLVYKGGKNSYTTVFKADKKRFRELEYVHLGIYSDNVTIRSFLFFDKKRQ
jgi:hypothetical protein